MTVWIYTLASTLVISLVGLIGALTLYLGAARMRVLLLPLVGLAAGSLIGNAFFQLIPETIHARGSFDVAASLLVVAGIVVSFSLEQALRSWQAEHPGSHEHAAHLSTMVACPDGLCEEHAPTGVALLQARPFALLDLGSDLVHNFIDGLMIGAAFQVNIGLGISTSVAVILHEIPHELGSFSVLVQSGLSRGKALLSNFLVALTAVLGGVVSLLAGRAAEGFPLYLLPFTAGAFVYLALGALLPEIHAHARGRQALYAVLGLLAGLGLMLLMGGHEH